MPVNTNGSSSENIATDGMNSDNTATDGANSDNSVHPNVDMLSENNGASEAHTSNESNVASMAISTVAVPQNNQVQTNQTVEPQNNETAAPQNNQTVVPQVQMPVKPVHLLVQMIDAVKPGADFAKPEIDSAKPGSDSGEGETDLDEPIKEKPSMANISPSVVEGGGPDSGSFESVEQPNVALPNKEQSNENGLSAGSHSEEAASINKSEENGFGGVSAGNEVASGSVENGVGSESNENGGVSGGNGIYSGSAENGSGSAENGQGSGSEEGLDSNEPGIEVNNCERRTDTDECEDKGSASGTDHFPQSITFTNYLYALTFK